MTFARSAARPVRGVKLLDRILKGWPLDEAHGIKRAAVGVLPHAMDRHDAGMFQPARDRGLTEEAVAALRMVGAQRLQAFHRHLTVQLLIPSDVDFTHAAPAP